MCQNYGKYFKVGIYQYFMNTKQWIRIQVLSEKIYFYVYVGFFWERLQHFHQILKRYRNGTFPFAPTQLVYLLMNKHRGTLILASCLALRPANRSSFKCQRLPPTET